MRRGVLLLAALVAASSAANASGSAGPGHLRVAYVARTPFPVGVYRADPGTKPVRLSNGRVDVYPTWSPDGKSLAFDHAAKPSARNLTCQIVVVRGKSTKPIPGVTAGCYGITWGRN